jgi:DNA-binding IclR family transcriptional regulator
MFGPVVVVVVVVRVVRLRLSRWTGHVAHMGVRRNAYQLLIGKSEGKRPLGRLGTDKR